MKSKTKRPFVVVRTYSAGVHFGELSKRRGHQGAREFGAVAVGMNGYGYGSGYG